MSDLNELLLVLQDLAFIILKNGGETFRAEETCIRVCKGQGVPYIEVLAIPTGVFITASADKVEYKTVIVRVSERTINLNKVNLANDISRRLAAKKMTVSEARHQLSEIGKKDPKNRLFYSLCAAVSAGFFTMLFGGGWFEFAIAFLCGCLTRLVGISVRNLNSFQFFNSLFGGVVSALLAVLSVTLFKMGNINIIIIGAIMPLLPGLAITNAIRDTMSGDLVSGTARGAEALIVAVAIAAGAGLVMYGYKMLGGVLV